MILCFSKSQIFDSRDRKQHSDSKYKYNIRLKRFNNNMLTDVIVQEAKAECGKSAYCSPSAPKIIFHTINMLYNAIK